ncbi:hypothetical protein RMATCC62417_14861 [Rhizopus microsporus]|nr:hypothetical protein RMATCC62417_14861 [Rhizopus microsporus]
MSFGVTRGTYEASGPSSIEMGIVRKTYATNLHNIWSDKRLFSKLLDHLLDVLLRIHLAPKREKEYREFVKQRIDKAKEKQEKREDLFLESSNQPFSRNQLRDILRAEYKNIKKYKKNGMKNDEEKAKWEARVKSCEKRIAYFKNEHTRRKLVII